MLRAIITQEIPEDMVPYLMGASGGERKGFKAVDEYLKMKGVGGIEEFLSDELKVEQMILDVYDSQGYSVKQMSDQTIKNLVEHGPSALRNTKALKTSQVVKLLQAERSLWVSRHIR